MSTSEPIVASHRGRGRRGLIVGLGVVLAAGVLIVLLVQATSVGSSAIDQVKAQTKPGLEELQSALAGRGDTLNLGWSAAPMSGGAQTVVVRMEAQPSGVQGQAKFMVDGRRVTAQDDFARELLSGAANSGSMKASTGSGSMGMP